MTMFTPAEHPFVGTDRIFVQEGSAPYDITTLPPSTGTMVLNQGHGVEVISAWTRDYLPDAKTLLYVKSKVTGLATHVTEDDVRLLDVFA